MKFIKSIIVALLIMLPIKSYAGIGDIIAKANTLKAAYKVLFQAVDTALLGSANLPELDEKIAEILKDEKYGFTTAEKETRIKQHYDSWHEKIQGWDEKVATGKAIDASDAFFCGMFYTLGKKEICELDYNKAAEYFKMITESDTALYKAAKLCQAGCEYQRTKNEECLTSVLKSINFTPTKQSSFAAIKFGFTDVYNKYRDEWIKTKLPQLKRLVRANDLDELKKYDSFGIPLVDSTLCANYGGEYWQKCRDDGMVYGYTENATTIYNYLKNSSNVLLIFNYINKEQFPIVDNIKDLMPVVKNNPYAGMILLLESSSYDKINLNDQVPKRVLKEILLKIPDSNNWKESPVSFNATGGVEVNSNYYNLILNKWKSTDK